MGLSAGAAHSNMIERLTLHLPKADFEVVTAENLEGLGTNSCNLIGSAVLPHQTS